MATKQSALFNRIQKMKDKIAANRDELRLLVEDAEDILGSADDAVQSLECACDRLSEYL